MTCQPCKNADETGWFGSNDSHCRTCHRTWRGTAQMHCATCHRHFTSVSACHAHMLPVGCGDPAGFVKKATGELTFQLVDRYGGPAWALNSGDRPGHWTLERRL